MEQQQKVFVLVRKVFVACNGFDVMSAEGSCVLGVFKDRNSAIDFTQHMMDGVADCQGQQRTFHLVESKEGRKPNFEFATMQRETALYPRFVFECTQEEVLSKES